VTLLVLGALVPKLTNFEPSGKTRGKALGVSSWLALTEGQLGGFVTQRDFNSPFAFGRLKGISPLRPQAASIGAHAHGAVSPVSWGHEAEREAPGHGRWQRSPNV
jgi:hypothetical protein